MGSIALLANTSAYSTNVLQESLRWCYMDHQITHRADKISLSGMGLKDYVLYNSWGHMHWDASTVRRTLSELVKVSL